MMIVLTSLFYALVIYCITVEVEVMNNPARSVRASLNAKAKIQEGAKLHDFAGYDRSYLINSALYSFICLLGLFSSQWVGFTAILLISLIATPFKKIPAFRAADSAICVLILLFIILNRYHFHIDLWQLILNKIHN